MKKIRSLLSLFGLVLALSACNLEIPAIESATVKSISSGRTLQTWTLNPAQIRELNVWMKENQRGWQSSLTAHAPVLLLNVKHVGGQQSTINVSQNFVVLAFRGEQFAQKLDSAEMRDLNVILLGGAARQE